MIHYLAVLLRGRETVAYVRCASESASLSTIAWFAQTYLRKSPQDRAGAWVLTNDGVAYEPNPDGVEAKQVSMPLAAFDPREVVGLQHYAIPSPPDLHPEDARNG